MKHRLTYLWVVGVVIFAPLMAALWHPSPAAASGEDYVFYKDTPVIYARDGVYGNGLTTFSPSDSGNVPSAFQSTYNSIVKDPSGNFNDGTYLATYQCSSEGGMKVYVLIGMTNSGFGSDTAAVYVLGGISSSPLVGNKVFNGTKVPSQCLPSHANTHGYTGSPTTFSLPLYSGLSDSAGKDWYQFLQAHGQNVKDPGTAKLEPKDTPIGGDDGGDGGGDGSVSDLGCNASSNPLSWVLCPVINDLLVPAASAIDGIITQELVIPAQNIFCSGNNTCDDYYTAWSSFRNLALGLLVVAGLVMIIAQAIGMEILDAYTIRKILPRVLIAALGITLSWTLMNFAVTLSNNLGYGVRDLIEAPFQNIANSMNLDFSGSWVANLFGGGSLLLLGGVTAWIATGGIAIMLSYLLTAMLAVLVAVVVLVLRQIVVVTMILVAPIALIAYVLPNTQRAFHLWWESFTKALLMFPLIAAFIAAGRVFSAIALNSNNGASVPGELNQVIGFVAYFGPYFAIPMTFRMAGGIMSGAGNLISQRAQGGFNALSGWRGRTRQGRIARARGQGLYRKDIGEFNHPWKKVKDPKTGEMVPKRMSVGRMLNTLGQYTLDADEMVPLKLGSSRARGGLSIPGFRRGAMRDHARIDFARRQQTQKALQEIDPGYKAGRLLAGLYTGEEHDYLKNLPAEARADFDHEFGIRNEEGSIVGYRAPSGWAERNRVAELFSQSSDQEVQEAASEMSAASELLEQYHMSEETHRVDPRLLGLMAAAREGRLGVEDIVDNHNAILRGEGDQMKAQHETSMLQQLAAPKRTSMARGHGIYFDEKGVAHSTYEDPLSDKAKSSVRRESLQDVSQGKAEDLQRRHGEAIIGMLSPFQTSFDAQAKIDGEDGTGKVIVHPGQAKTDPQELEEARILQDRIRTAAMYSYGDTGLQTELRRIWRRAGLKPEDLERTGVGTRRAEDMPDDMRNQLLGLGLGSGDAADATAPPPSA